MINAFEHIDLWTKFLAETLAETLACTRGGGVCRVKRIVDESDVSADCDTLASCCPGGGLGEALIRIERIDSTQAMRGDPPSRVKCRTSWTFQVSVLVARCMTVEPQNERPEESDNRFIYAGDDWRAVLSAVARANASRDTSVSGTVTAWSPYGPEGGCYGGVSSIIVT